MTDPYFIQGPATISFSGGRSSGYMLWRILQAHGGKLPDDVACIFANTGEEAEGTLSFVHEIEARWSVRVRWVEFDAAPSRWREVAYCSASRAGEPFDAMVDWKQYVPNHHQKLCSEFLKVRPMLGLARLILGSSFDQVIGIRADEPLSVAKHRNNADALIPLADAGVTRDEVLSFWKNQPFDLKIRPGEGNCKLCFENGLTQLRNVIRDSPDGCGVERWIGRESRHGYPMKKGHPIAVTARQARQSLPMFEAEAGDYEMLPCACHD